MSPCTCMPAHERVAQGTCNQTVLGLNVPKGQGKTSPDPESTRNCMHNFQHTGASHARMQDDVFGPPRGCDSTTKVYSTTRVFHHEGVSDRLPA